VLDHEAALPRSATLGQRVVILDAIPASSRRSASASCSRRAAPHHRRDAAGAADELDRETASYALEARAVQAGLRWRPNARWSRRRTRRHPGGRAVVRRPEVLGGVDNVVSTHGAVRRAIYAPSSGMPELLGERAPGRAPSARSDLRQPPGGRAASEGAAPLKRLQQPCSADESAPSRVVIKPARAALPVVRWPQPVAQGSAPRAEIGLRADARHHLVGPCRRRCRAARPTVAAGQHRRPGRRSPPGRRDRKGGRHVCQVSATSRRVRGEEGQPRRRPFVRRASRVWRTT
jgi:hypothetical protein